MQTPQEFIDTNTGKKNVGDTPENTGECVGLVEVWNDNLGLPHIWGNAIDLIKNASPTYYEIVYNKLGDTSQFPPDGAIVVLGKPYGRLADGTYAGHTGMSIKSDGNTLRLFQQNDPEGSTPSIKDYAYDACIGWLIPKVNISDSSLNTYGIDPTNTASAQVVYNTWHDVSQGKYISKTDYDSKVKSMQDTIDNLNQQVNDRNNDITTLNGQVKTAQKQIDSLEQQLDSATLLAKQLPQCQSELEQAVEDRKGLNEQISDLKNQLTACQSEKVTSMPTETPEIPVNPEVKLAVTTPQSPEVTDSLQKAIEQAKPTLNIYILGWFNNLKSYIKQLWKNLNLNQK